MKALYKAKLRVKIKSLAEEARIIRHEERKLQREGCSDWAIGSVHAHRVCNVRRESRATQWAYAFMRGVPYRAVERTAYLDRYERAYLTKRMREIVRSMTYSMPGEVEVEKWLSAVDEPPPHATTS